MALTADFLYFLNGTDHEHTTADDILSIDSATGSAVSNKAVSVPTSVSQVNVIINNDYDLDGKDVTARVRVTKLTDPTAGAIVKTETTEAMAWTAVPDGAAEGHNIETGSIDVSDCLSATLHIDVCMSEAGAHTGTEVIVQVGSEASVDGSWSDLVRYVCCVGTAVKMDCADTTTAGDSDMLTVNPVASGFDWDGKNLFILCDTIANSEIVYQTEHGADS